MLAGDCDAVLLLVFEGLLLLLLEESTVASLEGSLVTSSDSSDVGSCSEVWDTLVLAVEDEELELEVEH